VEVLAGRVVLPLDLVTAVVVDVVLPAVPRLVLVGEARVKRRRLDLNLRRRRGLGRHLVPQLSAAPLFPEKMKKNIKYSKNVRPWNQ